MNFNQISRTTSRSIEASKHFQSLSIILNNVILHLINQLSPVIELHLELNHLNVGILFDQIFISSQQINETFLNLYQSK